MNAKIFGLTSVVLCALFVCFAGDTKPDGGKEIRLPVGDDMVVRHLMASRDGRLLCYETSHGQTFARDETVTYWAFEPESGKAVNLNDLVKSQTEYTNMVIPEMRISDDGTKIAVLCKKKMGAKTMAVLVIDIKNQKVTEVTEAPFVNMWVWMGQNLYVCAVDDPADVQARKLGEIRAYDAATGKLTKLNACGAAITGSAAGKYLLVILDPDNPSKPVSVKNVEDEIWLVRLSTDGKVLGKICRANQLVWPPAISPDGKYIAYSCRLRENGGQKLYTKVIEADGGKEVLSVEGFFKTAAVSNDCDVIVWDSTPIEHGIQQAVGKRISRDGKVVVIAENVSAKCVSQNSVFYLDKTDDGNEHPWIVKKLDFDSPAVK